MRLSGQKLILLCFFNIIIASTIHYIHKLIRKRGTWKQYVKTSTPCTQAGTDTVRIIIVTNSGISSGYSLFRMENNIRILSEQFNDMIEILFR